MIRDGAFAFVTIFGNIAQGLAYWRFSTRFPSCNFGLHDHPPKAGIRSTVSLPPQLRIHSITEHTPGWYRSCSAFYAWKIISPRILLNVRRILTGLPTHSQYATISHESRQDSVICWLRAHTWHLTWAISWPSHLPSPKRGLNVHDYRQLPCRLSTGRKIYRDFSTLITYWKFGMYICTKEGVHHTIIEPPFPDCLSKGHWPSNEYRKI